MKNSLQDFKTKILIQKYRDYNSSVVSNEKRLRKITNKVKISRFQR